MISLCTIFSAQSNFAYRFPRGPLKEKGCLASSTNLRKGLGAGKRRQGCIFLGKIEYLRTALQEGKKGNCLFPFGKRFDLLCGETSRRPHQFKSDPLARCQGFISGHIQVGAFDQNFKAFILNNVSHSSLFTVFVDHTFRQCYSSFYFSVVLHPPSWRDLVSI